VHLPQDVQRSSIPLMFIPSKSLIFRFLRLFIAGFWQAVWERVMDGIFILAAFVWAGVKGKLSAAAWRASVPDVLFPFVWAMCAVALVHLIRTGIVLCGQLAAENSLARPVKYRSGLYRADGNLDETWEAPTLITHYTLKIIGVVVLLSCFPVLLGYYSWIKRPRPLVSEDEIRLEAAQEDTKEHLTGNLYVSPSGDPTDSTFTFINGGATQISKHKLVCFINFMTYQNFLILDGDRVQIVQDTTVPIESMGDGESTTCLSNLVNKEKKLACADVTFEYHYAIKTQPDDWREKDFRFATRYVGGKFEWQRQPIHSARSQCEVPGTEMPDTSGYKRVTVCASGCDFQDIERAVDTSDCGSIVFFEQTDPLKHMTMARGCNPQKGWLIIKRSAHALEDAKRPL
jgi:hypothetical protein